MNDPAYTRGGIESHERMRTFASHNCITNTLISIPVNLLYFHWKDYKTLV